MNLESLEEATMLRNRRARAVNLIDAAKSGPIDLRFAWCGERFDTFSVISSEPVRQAVIEACWDFIDETDKQLRKLGVHVKEEAPRERDAASWRREAEMLVRAWIRELGGRLIRKAHLIDALVLTTRDLRERAQGIEAQRAETQSGSVVDESLTPQGDAPQVHAPHGGTP